MFVMQDWKQGIDLFYGLFDVVVVNVGIYFEVFFDCYGRENVVYLWNKFYVFQYMVLWVQGGDIFVVQMDSVVMDVKYVKNCFYGGGFVGIIGVNDNSDFVGVYGDGIVMQDIWFFVVVFCYVVFDQEWFVYVFILFLFFRLVLRQVLIICLLVLILLSDFLVRILFLVI